MDALRDDQSLEYSDAWAWYRRGRGLHEQVGRAVDAERAYRRAAEEGVDCWLHLGILLATMRGREVEEERAFRRALESEDPEIAAWAALRLGNILQWRRGELDEARRCFTLAAERGSGVTSGHAKVNLGFLAAYEGDRHAAHEALRDGLVDVGDERGCDVGDSAAGPAKALAALASARATRRLCRRYRRFAYETLRLARALPRSSAPAVWAGRYLSATASARDSS